MITEAENLENHIPLTGNVLRRTFLQVNFPIKEYLSEAVLESQQTHKIPFSFVVPSHIPVQMCHHDCANLGVYQEHLQLPPSLGNISQYFRRSDDMSPAEAEVKYSIKFSIIERPSKANWPKSLKETIYPVYILPRRLEAAPLLIDSSCKFYQLRTKKSLTKGAFRSKIGSMTLSSFQSPGIDLRDGSWTKHDHETSTNVRINLRFEPQYEDQLETPPRIISSDTKLKIMTFFGVQPWDEFPNISSPSSWSPRQTYWSESIHLSSENHLLDWVPQRNSHSGCPGVYYTATIDIPAVLPDDRVYPPTFHSCFISRTYSLKTTIHYRDHGKARKQSSASLNIPVQLYVS